MFGDNIELPLSREAELSSEQAEQELLDAIRQKRENAWASLIEQYQRRLLNFAISKLRRREDAEDVIQETFISFIKGLENYRGEVNLETYLFTILRNKIIDKYRSSRSKSISLLQDVYYSSQDENESDAVVEIASPRSSESWIVSQNEQYQIQQNILARALVTLCRSFKDELKFRNLKIIELLLYCGVSVSTAAELVKVEESTIRAFKYRCLRHLRKNVEELGASKDFPYSNFENLLTTTWESQRITCPKRSTIGAFLLEKLDPEWFDYIDLHLTTLGCHFCRANLKDLRQQKTVEEHSFRDRIMASTVGFFNNTKK
ncbi:MAG: RNA polymerase sigma factor [Sedimentisphaerales bacterium]